MASTHRRFKDLVYEQLARIGRATSSPKRLELLDLLCQGPKTVEVLAREAAVTVANASQHLQVLRAARLAACEKRGLYVEYRLADEAVCDFYLSLRQLAETRLAEIEQVTREYLTERGSLEPVASAELLRRVKSGEVTVLDVRPEAEYRAGHLRGALSVPLGELKGRLKHLPRTRAVVAYCRGPYCVMAIEAVELLRAKGFTAHRLELGVADLRAQGWRIATGA
jgi:rhodanese-related sulfurtransferase